MIGSICLDLNIGLFLLLIFPFYNMHFCCLLYVFLLVKASNNYIPQTKVPPAKRAYLGMGCIPSKNALIIFGGSIDKDYLNDIWLYHLDSNHWEELFPSSDILPCNFYAAPRAEYGSFLSALTEDFYIFGGITISSLKNEFWKFNHNDFSWTNILTKNTPTLRRRFTHTSYVENGHEYFAIFGGYSIDGFKDDTQM